METSMSIDLTLKEKTLRATAVINLKGANVKLFSFLLNNTFIIEEVSCNQQTAKWEKKGEKQIASFILLAQEIVISCEDFIDEIRISYSGGVSSANMNVITDELKAISYYSAWYPMQTSVQLCKDEVIIRGCKDYYVVKGIYNDADGTWKYGGQGHEPYNIIAYTKTLLKTVSNPYLNIHYISDDYTGRVNKLSYYYQDVLSYYNGDLYSKKIMPKCDIACLCPIISKGGAYQAEGLIATATLGVNDYELAAINAHEIAHNWCTGAPDNWEDWLNETTAEWSALMYALEKKDDALFDWIISSENRLESYKLFPPIKTNDGSRPDGVHHRGVILFYEIYKKYGKDIIKTILQTFAGLENKNTEQLFEKLRGEIGGEIPACIEKGLALRDYSLLYI